MNKLRIRNDFTNRETWIDADRPLNRRKVKRIRARLCRPECRSGDILGGRGPQENPALYAEIIEKVWGME